MSREEEIADWSLILARGQGFPPDYAGAGLYYGGSCQLTTLSQVATNPTVQNVDLLAPVTFIFLFGYGFPGIGLRV
ncbi:uncharacterized protein KD926_000753 [Aspergillus affinis]|uniref:uncharacterized protein n=1 Tax=Aspergillus affinis TaxID=1070780 RepID=UPI0022FE5F8B|nr:uncharacterized protein KD926_000753 [Aspergillus affinis]KAI9037180.1 hypothetical protein KD926_000753 [Aspergillus affinis]